MQRLRGRVHSKFRHAGGQLPDLSGSESAMHADGRSCQPLQRQALRRNAEDVVTSCRAIGPAWCFASVFGRLMSIFTDHELEFLTSLNTGWRRLYWNELARLLNEDDNRCDARQESDSNFSIRFLYFR
jgi:hypothetical protein